LNQLRLVRIVLSISREYTDARHGEVFLRNFYEKLNHEIEKQASALCLTAMGKLKITMNQLEEAKELADKAAAFLESMIGVESDVFSSYYFLLSSYYKFKGMPTEFYKNALLYLIYTPVEEIPVDQSRSLAFEMGISALVSTEIYNFGELLAHPIIQSLHNSEHEWLRQILLAFNNGSIDQYEKLVAMYGTQLENQIILKNNASLLREKISIFALLELIANRNTTDRIIPFQSISEFCRVREDEVEFLVMKSFSLKLIRGSIDGLEKTVSISWVQPRILDINQVAKLKDRFANWTLSVNQVLNLLQNETATELHVS